MRIEKINENQIRCVLTGEDLASRQLQLSELAYGTDKAKALFRDMIQQAAYKFGFDAENIPLMIEAIPLSEGSIVLIVTKVENPEELDTRFSSFAPSVQEAPRSESDPGQNAFEQLMESIRSQSAQDPGQRRDDARVPEEKVSAMAEIRRFILMNRLYSFTSLSDVIAAAQKAGGRFTGESMLAQDPAAGIYYLSLSMPDLESVSVQQNVLAAISEYGRIEPVSFARRDYLREHCRILSETNALEDLALLAP